MNNLSKIASIVLISIFIAACGKHHNTPKQSTIGVNNQPCDANHICFAINLKSGSTDYQVAFSLNQTNVNKFQHFPLAQDIPANSTVNAVIPYTAPTSVKLAHATYALTNYQLVFDDANWSDGQVTQFTPPSCQITASPQSNVNNMLTGNNITFDMSQSGCLVQTTSAGSSCGSQTLDASNQGCISVANKDSNLDIIVLPGTLTTSQNISSDTSVALPVLQVPQTIVDNILLTDFDLSLSKINVNSQSIPLDSSCVKSITDANTIKSNAAKTFTFNIDDTVTPATCSVSDN